MTQGNHAGSLDINDRGWARVGRRLQLSPRQLEIVRILLEGSTIAGAARELHIRPDTVKTHLKRVYRRLGVRSRVELAVRVLSAATKEHLVRQAVRHGLGTRTPHRGGAGSRTAS